MTRKILNVVLPGLPPTVNHLYKTSMRGIRYKTQGGKAWQERTVMAMRQARDGRPTFDGEVAVDIEFRTPDRRRWDIDNRLKALLDCLQMSGAIKDDRQIARLHVERVASCAHQAETEIVVSLMERTFEGRA